MHLSSGASLFINALNVMNQKQNILNREHVIDILTRCANTGSMALASALIMHEVAKELADICQEYHQGTTVSECILTRFTSLRPTDEQVHAALIRLFDVKKVDGIHYLFSSSRQYFAIFKALVFLSVMTPDYGCYARMEAYISRLFASGIAPRIRCNQDALSKKCIGKPYTLPLQDWENQRCSKELKAYWPVAIQFLQILHEECGTESGSRQ